MIKDIHSVNLDQHIMLNSATDMNHIMKPLAQHGITHFAYSNCRKEGGICTREHLSNIPSISEWFIKERIYKHALNGEVDDYSSSYTLWRDILGKSKEIDNVFSIISNDFNVANGIVIVKKEKSVCHIYYFGADPSDTGMSLFYMNNLPLLDLFIEDFHSNAADLLKASFQQRYSLGHSDDLTILTSKEYQNVLHSGKTLYLSNMKHHDLHKRYSLSEKEIQCASYFTTGMSSKEIAIAMNISYRTVEAHIANMKQKTKCKNSKMLLIRLLSSK